MRKRLIVLDDFYENPEEVYLFAKNREFREDIRYYKGVRSTTRYLPIGAKNKIENALNVTIPNSNWYFQLNGCFQITLPKDPTVYHHDLQDWAGILYLDKNAPLNAGTKTYKNIEDGARDRFSETKNTYRKGHLDSSLFKEVDSIGNVFNRLVLMDGALIHSAGEYYGDSLQNGRLVQLFFFDITTG